MQDGPKLRVLFLCTGSSCRSQIAKGRARSLKSNVIEPCSDGVATHGLNPHAVKVMAETGANISRQRPKHIDALNQHFDCGIAVCDKARETCHVFPGSVKKIYRGIKAPPYLARHSATKDEAPSHYRLIRDEGRALVESRRDAPEKG